MKILLIAVLALGPKFGQVGIVAEFDDMAACQYAQKLLKNEVNGVAICVPKKTDR